MIYETKTFLCLFMEDICKVYETRWNLQSNGQKPFSKLFPNPEKNIRFAKKKNVKGEEKLKLQKRCWKLKKKKFSHTWHQSSYDDESIPRDNPIKLILSSVERTQFVIKFVNGMLLQLGLP